MCAEGGWCAEKPRGWSGRKRYIPVIATRMKACRMQKEEKALPERPVSAATRGMGDQSRADQNEFLKPSKL